MTNIAPREAVSTGAGLSFRLARSAAKIHAAQALRLLHPVAAEGWRDGAAGDRAAAADEIEAAVVAQVRALLRQPEVVVSTWRTAYTSASDVYEHEVLQALEQIELL